MHPDFVLYCQSKKIDPELWLKGDEIQFSNLEREFLQMLPNSFTSQKLFLINGIRRKYHYKGEDVKYVSEKESLKIESNKEIEVSISEVPKVVVKPKTLIPSASNDSPKPNLAKPVIKPKIPGSENNSSIAKPVIPSLKNETSDELPKKPSALKPKVPVAKKEVLDTPNPLIKPIIPALKKEEQIDTTLETPAKKPSVLKPKIPTKPKE